jgi:hypothetical protein
MEEWCHSRIKAEHHLRYEINVSVEISPQKQKSQLNQLAFLIIATHTA